MYRILEAITLHILRLIKVGRQISMYCILRALGRFITRFSTDGDSDDKQVDIKISSSENVEIFLAQYL